MANGIDVSLGFSTPFGFTPQINLTADSVSIEIMRNASILSLPNQNAGDRGGDSPGSGVPEVVAIDFGIMQEDLIIGGEFMDESLPLDASNHPVTAFSFMRSFRKQWVYMQAAVYPNGDPYGKGIAKLRLDNEVWGVMPMRLSFSRNGGELHWSFRASFSVISWPEETTFAP